MTKLSVIMTALVATMALGAADAHAGGQEGSIGVGGELSLRDIGGLSLNYDAGLFHLGGFFGLSDDDGEDNTNLYVGGRFYYHLHSTLSSDFGVGGGIALASIDNAADRQTALFIEPGFQFRTFLNGGNVALSLTGGISIGVVDADGVTLGSQFNGVAGVHYYFF